MKTIFYYTGRRKGEHILVLCTERSVLDRILACQVFHHMEGGIVRSFEITDGCHSRLPLVPLGNVGGWGFYRYVDWRDSQSLGDRFMNRQDIFGFFDRRAWEEFREKLGAVVLVDF